MGKYEDLLWPTAEKSVAVWRRRWSSVSSFSYSDIMWRTTCYCFFALQAVSIFENVKRVISGQVHPFTVYLAEQTFLLQASEFEYQPWDFCPSMHFAVSDFSCAQYIYIKTLNKEDTTRSLKTPLLISQQQSCAKETRIVCKTLKTVHKIFYQWNI